MTTVYEIMNALEKLGDEQTKKTLMRHGAKAPFFGVKITHLKTILKKTKKNHALSLALYNTGNSDAMYLAGLMADEKKITAIELEDWLQKAYWYCLSEYTVPWVAAETNFGFELGQKWIQNKEEKIAAAGWCTVASFAAINDDKNIDEVKYTQLLQIAVKNIHEAPNRVKYCMNNFVIAVGVYIKALTNIALAAATQIGEVEVLKAGTACKVPPALTYIQKSISMGRIGKKRKTARC